MTLAPMTVVDQVYSRVKARIWSVVSRMVARPVSRSTIPRPLPPTFRILTKWPTTSIATSVPDSSPRRRRISLGIVTWPLALTRT